MKNFLLLLIFSFLILQSFELDPNKKREFKDLRKLQYNLEEDSDPSDLQYSDVEYQLTKEKKIKPTMLRFGGFSKKADKNNNANYISLNIYFKNVGKLSEQIFLKYLFFIVKLKKTNTRKLEEGESEPNRTLCAVLDKGSLETDIVEYKANNNITIDEYNSNNAKPLESVNDFDTFEVINNFQFLDVFDPNKLGPNTKNLIYEKLQSEESDVNIQSQEDLYNVQEKTQGALDNILFFKVYDLTQLGYLYYKIKGFFDRDMPFQKEKLNFSYIQYYEKKYFEGELEKIPDLKDIHNHNYTLTFRIKDFIDTNLDDGCKANISQYKISRKRMLEGDNLEELYLMAMEPGLLRLDETSPVMNHNYGRKIASSSGLSGGAIAGIVIACVVALVGIALAFIYFKRPNIKPADVSAIEFYNNRNVNSSVQVIQN